MAMASGLCREELLALTQHPTASSQNKIASAQQPIANHRYHTGLAVAQAMSMVLLSVTSPMQSEKGLHRFTGTASTAGKLYLLESYSLAR